VNRWDIALRCLRPCSAGVMECGREAKPVPAFAPRVRGAQGAARHTLTPEFQARSPFCSENRLKAWRWLGSALQNSTN
jgi:hypothetical protein